MANLDNSSVYSAMQEGNPIKRYKKSILGKVYVTVLDPISQQAIEGRILKGDPNSNSEECYVDIWSEKEDVFFRRMNKRHFETGNLISVSTKNVVQEKSPNEISDEEIEAAFNEKFFTLKNLVDKMTSEAPVYRILQKAKELEKSEKIVKFLEGKLSELQLKEYSQE